MHNKPIKFIRLKSYSTIGKESLIEIFEIGYQQKIAKSGYRYVERVLSLKEIHHLLNYNKQDCKYNLPEFLQIEENERVILSISQKLIGITKSLLNIRREYKLKFKISIFLNSVLPVMANLAEISSLLEMQDELVLNTKFSLNLIESIVKINAQKVLDPPIPSLCQNYVPIRCNYHINNKRNIYISTFSRVIPEKQIHTIVNAMKSLDNKYILNIYGFEKKETHYQKYIRKTISNDNLTHKVNCIPIIKTLEERKMALENTDICVNLSTTFEETMGKTILEACYWGKNVIANDWNGFSEILPEKNLISTYWNNNDWYHTRSEDLVAKINGIKHTNSDESLMYFQNFLENIKNLRRDEKNNNIEKMKPISTNKSEIRKIIEKLYCPKLIKIQDIVNQPKHPYVIYLSYDADLNYQECIANIDKWYSENPYSVYADIAIRMIGNLKQQQILEKEGIV